MKRPLQCLVVVLMAGSAVSSCLAQASAPSGAASVAETAADALKREHEDELVSSRVYAKASNLLKWGDFDGLERLFATPVSAETLGGGTMPLPDQQWSIGAALGNWQPEDRANDLLYESQAAALLDWARRRPELALAHVAYADVLTNQAWAIRGGDYANKVPEEQMARFRALCKQALAYLRQHRTVVESQGYGRWRMLNTLRDSGTNADELWGQTRDYIRMDPTARNLYRFLGRVFVPRWFGDPDGVALEFVARESVKLSRDKIGMTSYAIIYSTAASTHYDEGLFGETHASWPDMKQGFEDLLAERPTLEWRNRYAYFACLSKDVPTLRKQLAVLGEELKRFQNQWGSTGARMQADCVRLANQL